MKELFVCFRKVLPLFLLFFTGTAHAQFSALEIGQSMEDVRAVMEERGFPAPRADSTGRLLTFSNGTDTSGDFEDARWYEEKFSTEYGEEVDPSERRKQGRVREMLELVGEYVPVLHPLALRLCYYIPSSLWQTDEQGDEFIALYGDRDRLTLWRFSWERVKGL